MYTTNLIALIGLGALTGFASYDFDTNLITSTLGFTLGIIAVLTGVAGLLFFNKKQ